MIKPDLTFRCDVKVVMHDVFKEGRRPVGYAVEQQAQAVDVTGLCARPLPLGHAHARCWLVAQQLGGGP